MAAFKFPDWMNADQSALSDTYAASQQPFDFSAIDANVADQQGMNTARGLRSGEAMTRAAQARAVQGGGKVAASFAAGGAQLPIMAQNAAMTGNIAALKLQNAQAQMAQRAALAQGLSNAGLQQQSLKAGFFGDTMARKQQESQFGRQLGQQESQFGRNLAQQGQQFGQTMDYQNRALGQNESQFSRSFGLDKQQNAFQRAMAAYGMIPNNPMYSTGPNATSYDMQAQSTANTYDLQRRNLRQRAMQLI